MLATLTTKQRQRAEAGAAPSTTCPEKHATVSKTCEKSAFFRGRKRHRYIFKSRAADDTPSFKLRVRANSASPQPCISGRRALGASVAFESALPTQIWQASPNPSPPPRNETTSLFNSRMVSSMSNGKKHLLRDQLISKTLHNSKFLDQQFKEWISDVEIDVSSDETDCSFIRQRSLSSNSSNDERDIGSRLSNVRLGSSTTTGTTDSNSSLDIQQAREEGLAQNESLTITGAELEQRERDYLKRTEFKRRAANTNEISSSSTTSDEELEAMGWDEKTILALVSRGKGKLLQPQATVSQAERQAVKSGHRQATVILPVNAKRKDSNFHTERSAQISTSSMDPYPRSCFHRPIVHPNSCVLSRRDNRSLSKQQHFYRNNSYGRSTSIEQHVKQEILAVVVQSYKPPYGWENEYKVLPVKKGDYVSLLNHPKCNAIWRKTVCTDTVNGSTQSAANLPETKDIVSDSAWVYVRRWCVDHLVSTGPPGYIPTQYCKPLSESDVFNMWQRSVRRKAIQHGVMGAQTCTSKKSADYPVGRAIYNPFERSGVTELSLKVTELGHVHQNCQRSRFTLQSLVPSCSLSNEFYSGSSGPPPSPHHDISFSDQPGHPPPPPGFGSGGSIGSETEDKDSGKGPSSGSEWSSGRGCSSNATLNSASVDKLLAQERLSALCSDKHIEDTRPEWNMRHCSVLSSDRSSTQGDDGVCFRRFEKLSSNEDENHQQRSTNNNIRPLNKVLLSGGLSSYFPVPITLSTRVDCLPVLSLRANGSPQLAATEVYSESQSSRNNSGINLEVQGADDLCRVDHEMTNVDAFNCSGSACWEPYKTVIHIKENALEKFTLV